MTAPDTGATPETTVRHYQGDGDAFETFIVSSDALMVGITDPGVHRFEVIIPAGAAIQTVTLATRIAKQS